MYRYIFNHTYLSFYCYCFQYMHTESGCECPLCGKTLSSKQRVLQHISTCHENGEKDDTTATTLYEVDIREGRRSYRCSPCGNCFTRRYSCVRHIKLQHGQGQLLHILFSHLCCPPPGTGDYMNRFLSSVRARSQ